jgi:hypothetical protein
LGDLPEEAEDFASSVEEKVLSMKEWITDKKHVTEKMIKALVNMQSGIDKWNRDW